MKPSIALLLTFLLILFVGCSSFTAQNTGTATQGTNTSQATSHGAASDTYFDPLLEELSQAIVTAEPMNISFLVDGTAINLLALPEQLSEIASLLTQGEISYALRSVSITPKIEILSDSSSFSIALGTHEGNTHMQVTLSESSSAYTLNADVLNTLATILTGDAPTPVLGGIDSVQGEYTTLHSVIPEVAEQATAVEFYEIGEHVIQVYNTLYYNYSEEPIADSAIELFNPTTGESVAHYQFEGQYIPDSLRYLAAENTLRFSTDDYMFHYVSLAPADGIYEAFTEPLPASLVEMIADVQNASFDETPSHRAVSNELGIYIYPTEQAQDEEVFISSDILLQLEYFDTEIVDAKPPYFTDVRFMNDGKTLVSTILWEMSQSGSVGLYIRDMQTGAQEFHTGLFHPMFYSLFYLGDDAILTRSIDGEGMYFNLVEGSQEDVTVPDIDQVNTFDLVNYYHTRNTGSDNGGGELLLYGDDTPLITSQERNIHISDVTQNYVGMYTTSDYNVIDLLIYPT